jgi:predicted lipid-binding transport protein (Tim44 family)
VNHRLAVGLAVATLAAFVAADLADARRLSGGRSLGVQRPGSTPTQPATPPSQSGAPAGATATNAAPATPPGAGPASNPVMPPNAAATSAPRPTGAAAAPASARSSWLGPVAGLAAGLGLAALAAHLGFSEELMSLLLIGLLVMAAVVVARLVLSRRTPMRAAMPYAGAGAGLGTTPGGYETQVPPPARIEPTVAHTGSAPMRGSVPAGFDAAGFAREARKQFLAVQAAHDRHDAKALAEVMTPELHREIVREMDASGAARPTEIVEVDAEVVDVATERDRHWVSVRFAGTAREGGVLEPFDEVWNLVKPVDGTTGWLIAGIQPQVLPS